LWKTGLHIWIKEKKKLNTHNCKWKAPPDEFIKLNVDAIYSEDSHSRGWVSLLETASRRFAWLQ
jgi:hypothetical protein